MLYSEKLENLRIVPHISTKLNDKIMSDVLMMEWLFSEICTSSIKKNKRIYIKEAAARIAFKITDIIKLSSESEKVKKIEINISDFLDNGGLDSISDIVEGLLLGFYKPVCFAMVERPLETIDVQICLNYSLQYKDKDKMIRALIKESIIITESIIYARNLVNKPGNMLRPGDLSKEIKKCFNGTSVDIDIFDYKDISEIGLKALENVGKSSAYSPEFIIIRYLNDLNSSDITALVGKGVTCDTGGYCLKPAAAMTGIKGDMAGAASVIGAIRALAKMQVQINIYGLIPVCENRISNNSILPGDVIDSYSGKSIEIINTDAEGRLILADAVCYAVRNLNANKIVDVATLTGSVANMLGFTITGAICDSEELEQLLLKASERSGEQYCLLPAFAEHQKMLESEIADIKNLGSDHCGTIAAGLFVRSFAEGKPWLHLDIAGTAWTDNPVFEFQSKGATGVAVSTLYYLSRGV